MAVVYGQNIAAFVKTAMIKACYIKWGATMPRLLTLAHLTNFHARANSNFFSIC